MLALLLAAVLDCGEPYDPPPPRPVDGATIVGV